MVPTPLGESLMQPVRRVLIEIQSTIETRPVFDPALSTRRFTLMTSDYVATVLMTAVLRRVAMLAPKVSFEFLPNTVDSPSDCLDHAEIDFLMMPDSMLDDQHPKAKLLQDDYVCLVASANLAIRHSITLEDYLRTGHVVLQFSRHRVSAVDQWLTSQFGDVRKIEVVAMSVDLLPQFVIGTHRVATVQRRVAQYYSTHGGLKLLEPPFRAPPIVESLQWHRAFGDDPGNRWLRDIVIAVAQGSVGSTVNRHGESVVDETLHSPLAVRLVN